MDTSWSSRELTQDGLGLKAKYQTVSLQDRTWAPTHLNNLWFPSHVAVRSVTYRKLSCG